MIMIYIYAYRLGFYFIRWSTRVQINGVLFLDACILPTDIYR